MTQTTAGWASIDDGDDVKIGKVSVKSDNTLKSLVKGDEVTVTIGTDGSVSFSK